jgi:hypothetical protein
MPKHFLDPSTTARRQRLFKNKYADQVAHLQYLHKINGLNIIKNLPRGLAKVHSKFSKTHSPDEVLLWQARFVDRQAAKLTDAMIDAQYDIKIYEKMQPKEKDRIFFEQYDGILTKLLLPKIKDPKLKRKVDEIGSYFSIPDRIHHRRKHHAKLIKKIIKRVQRNGQSPKSNLLKALDRILTKKKSGERSIVKAMDVCVAASIYADLRKMDGLKWRSAYREGMEVSYPVLKEQAPEIIDSIVELH